MQGAYLQAGPVYETQAGFRDAMGLFDFEKITSGSPSNETGDVSIRSVFPREISRDSVFDVVAFHPELGTAHIETTLEELLSGTPFKLDLELGISIKGQIVDEKQVPIEGMIVQAYGTTPAESISTSGIGARTDKDGLFTIRGVRFGNAPASITGFLQERDFDPETLRLTTHTTSATFRLSNGTFHPESQTWVSGAIVAETIMTSTDTANGVRGFVRAEH